MNLSKEWKIALIVLSVWLVIISVVQITYVINDNEYTESLFDKFKRITREENISNGRVNYVMYKHPLRGANGRFVEIDNVPRFIVVDEVGAINSEVHLDLEDVLRTNSRIFKRKNSDSLSVFTEGSNYIFLLK